MYGIFTYIYHENQPNVGKYNMDPMGHEMHKLSKIWPSQKVQDLLATTSLIRAVKSGSTMSRVNQTV